VFEIVTYRLRESADPHAFGVIDEALQTRFFYQQPGLVRRTTGRSDDGTWVSINVWDSTEHADAAEAKTEEMPEFARMLEVIDPTTIRVQRFESL
jgi:hypothetical protein